MPIRVDPAFNETQPVCCGPRDSHGGKINRNDKSHNDIAVSRWRWHQTPGVEEIHMGKNLVIVGGGAGGGSAAAEAKRNDPSLQVTLVEKGKFVAFAA